MEREGPFTSPIEEDVMGKKIASALLVAAGLLLVSAPASAQDLGPHFKKVKDGIITYVAKPDEFNCTIILTNEGVVLIDSGHSPTELTDDPQGGEAAHAVADPVLDQHRAACRSHDRPLRVLAANHDCCRRRRNRLDEGRLQSSPHRATARRVAEMRAAAEGYRLVTPQIEYKDKMTINLGERTFELMYIKNVHSGSDTVIWLPKERIVFTAASIGVKRVNNLRPSVTIPDTSPPSG